MWVNQPHQRRFAERIWGKEREEFCPGSQIYDGQGKRWKRAEERSGGRVGKLGRGILPAVDALPSPVAVLLAATAIWLLSKSKPPPHTQPNEEAPSTKAAGIQPASAGPEAEGTIHRRKRKTATSTSTAESVISDQGARSWGSGKKGKPEIRGGRGSVHTK
jgi:hypothetical protein